MARAISRGRNAADPDVQPMETRTLNTVPETARVLSLGARTVYSLISQGRLEAVKVGRSTRVTGDAITRFVEGLRPIRPVSPDVPVVPYPRQRVRQEAYVQLTGSIPAPRRRLPRN